MEHRHKQDWLDNKKANFNAKMAMIKKHKEQWFGLNEKFIHQMGQGVAVETVLAQKLSNMIKLHEAQNKEWAAMCEANHKKSSEIAKKHEAELEAFKKGLK